MATAGWPAPECQMRRSRILISPVSLTGLSHGAIQKNPLQYSRAAARVPKIKDRSQSVPVPTSRLCTPERPPPPRLAVVRTPPARRPSSARPPGHPPPSAPSRRRPGRRAPTRPRPKGRDNGWSGSAAAHRADPGGDRHRASVLSPKMAAFFTPLFWILLGLEGLKGLLGGALLSPQLNFNHFVQAMNGVISWHLATVS